MRECMCVCVCCSSSRALSCTKCFSWIARQRYSETKSVKQQSTIVCKMSFMDSKTKAASLQCIIMVCGCCRAFSCRANRARTTNVQCVHHGWQDKGSKPAVHSVCAGCTAFSRRAPSCARCSSWMIDEGGKSGLHYHGVWLLQGAPSCTVCPSWTARRRQPACSTLSWCVVVAEHSTAEPHRVQGVLHGRQDEGGEPAAKGHHH